MTIVEAENFLKRRGYRIEYIFDLEHRNYEVRPRGGGKTRYDQEELIQLARSLRAAELDPGLLRRVLGVA